MKKIYKSEPSRSKEYLLNFALILINYFQTKYCRLVGSGINMCYSIRVETSLDALQKKYPSTIDYQLFLRIYEDRSRGIANLKIPKGIDQNFLNLDSLVGEKIRSYIWNYNKQKQLNSSRF